MIAALCGAAPARAAETIYGVTGGTAPALVRFTSAAPGTIESTVAVTGLQPAETALGIDVRPATGELMALGSTGRLYRVNPANGGATAIGAAIALTGTRFGIDFNPWVDRLRVVSDAERNYRISPLDGTLAGTDTDLAPAGNVVSAAYDRNSPGAPSTLFALDSSANRLVRIGGVDGTPSPNLGAVAQPRLTYYWISSGVSTLVRGHTDVPEFESSARITGLAAGETVIGLDQRPATGELVALTNQDRLYVVEPLTANAAQIGTAPLATPLGSVLAGVDFNPGVDRIRVVADDESNLRLNSFTGAIAATDSNLAPPARSPRRLHEQLPRRHDGVPLRHRRAASASRTGRPLRTIRAKGDEAQARRGRAGHGNRPRDHHDRGPRSASSSAAGSSRPARRASARRS